MSLASPLVAPSSDDCVATSRDAEKDTIHYNALQFILRLLVLHFAAPASS